MGRNLFHLLYTKGWPAIMPTHQEAVLLGEIRRHVAQIMQIPIAYTDPEDIQTRYAELMAQHATRGGGTSTPGEESLAQQPLWSAEIVAASMYRGKAASHCHNG